MSKEWRIKPKESEDVIKQLLINRGIKGEEEIENFFSPKLTDFEKDLDIPGIEKSFKRIEQAIVNQELIVVFGDYDVDGITASAILYKALTSLNAKVLPYLPHREKEGYGLSKLGLEFARDSGATLVITVDNGIVAIDQAEYAKQIGLDLIITDHHTLGDKKPSSFSIVHSTKMCGAAVAWCLVRGKIKKELEIELLELVAVATVADMMPLIGINRALVSEGLKILNKTKNLGFLNLFKESRIEKGNLKSYEIGHIIAPRINAIGRLEHAIDALRLICTKDEIKARRLAKLLHETNIKRQELTLNAYNEAVLMAEVDIEKKIHVLFSEDWHPGIIGLIAARITEQYGKPSIAISISGENAKGSARSIKGINITEALRQAKEFLIDVGGHSGAAGFSIKTTQIKKFKKEIEKIISELPEFESGKFLDIEAEISSNQLNKDLARQIEEFDPFGFMNPKPILATRRMKVSDIRTVGSGKHLKFKAEGIDAIAFNMGELEVFLTSGQIVDIAYNLEINKFNGAEILQLGVKDIKLG